jgi:uncharacterized membrane protein
MTQQEFLNLLRECLEKCEIQNIPDILNDYREHFVDGIRNGKTEKEISLKLGDPATIAKAYETEVLIAKIKSIHSNFQWEMALRVIGRLLVLAPFNLILFFLPGLLLFVFLTTGWSVAVALGAASLAILGFGLKAGLIGLSIWLTLTLGSASLALLGVGIGALFIMFLITKFIMVTLINYLQWNLKFVLEK